MDTQHALMLEKLGDIPIMPPVLALLLTLISSNYPCFEHHFMDPKVFEPLKVDCIMFEPRHANNHPRSLVRAFILCAQYLWTWGS